MGFKKLRILFWGPVYEESHFLGSIFGAWDIVETPMCLRFRQGSC